MYTALLVVPAILAVATFLVVQMRWSARAIRLFRQARELGDLTDEAELPRVVVAIGLRGADPSLSSCMEALLTQDYPNYLVSVVIDHESDPAWDAIRPLLKRYDTARVRVQVLTNPRRTCSLKISSVLQAIEGLDESYQVVAMADSDADFKADWLRRLVRPFQDPEIQVTGGMRWFDGSAGGLGTMIRCFWNSFCTAWMCAYNLPWGGCMAVRRQFLFETNLYKRLQEVMCEDLAAGEILKYCKAKMAYAPVVGLCSETIGLKSFITYGRRQLVYARRYDGSWPVIYAMNVGSMVAYTAVLGFAIYHLFSHQWAWLAVEAATIAAYWLVMGVAQSRMDAVFNERRRVTIGQIMLYPLAGVMAHWLQFEFTLLARFRTKVLWRGITYKVRLDGTIRMGDHVPYRPGNVRTGTESVI